jgi:D-lactate dehydrogenase
MKIGFFELEDWEKEYVVGKLKGHKLKFFNEVLSLDNVEEVKDFDVVCIFIYSKLDKKILDKFENLGAVVSRSTGYDHIDLGVCKKNKIKVLNVPCYGENTVAEHTFALILSLSRKIHKSYERTVRSNFSLDDLRGFDLKDKTIGVVGLGNIGKNVARIANGFQMKIIAFDVFKDLKFAKKFGIKYVKFNDLLKDSDIITFHCPYNKHTHHLLNKKNIGLLKDNAHIINTSRGQIIETNALVKALVEKKIGGAGLDVLEDEAIVKEEIQLLSKNYTKKDLKNIAGNHLLLTLGNVIVTPHNAFNSVEALRRILETTLENIDVITKKKRSGNFVMSK